MILQDNEIDPDLRVKTLNIVKMTMYLFTQIMKVKDTKLAADVSSPAVFVMCTFNLSWVLYKITNEKVNGWTSTYICIHIRSKKKPARKLGIFIFMICIDGMNK